jgi:hypothetical protein
MPELRWPLFLAHSYPSPRSIEAIGLNEQSSGVNEQVRGRYQPPERSRRNVSLRLAVAPAWPAELVGVAQRTAPLRVSGDGALEPG